MKKRFIVPSAVAMLVLFLSGCASGPKFAPVVSVDVPPGKALVYIYRTPSFAGSAVQYAVNAGERKIVQLQNGGYYPYICDPGSIEFWAATEARASLTIDVAAGETYYLRGSLGIGFFVGHPKLQLIPAEQALSEIADCVLIPGAD
jgi:hypothetical protein